MRNDIASGLDGCRNNMLHCAMPFVNWEQGSHLESSPRYRRTFFTCILAWLTRVKPQTRSSELLFFVPAPIK